jgi:hypothetical protein
MNAINTTTVADWLAAGGRAGTFVIRAKVIGTNAGHRLMEVRPENDQDIWVWLSYRDGNLRDRVTSRINRRTGLDIDFPRYTRPRLDQYELVEVINDSRR